MITKDVGEWLLGVDPEYYARVIATIGIAPAAAIVEHASFLREAVSRMEQKPSDEQIGHAALMAKLRLAERRLKALTASGAK